MYLLGYDIGSSSVKLKIKELKIKRGCLYILLSFLILHITFILSFFN